MHSVFLLVLGLRQNVNLGFYSYLGLGFQLYFRGVEVSISEGPFQTILQTLGLLLFLLQTGHQIRN